MKSARLDSRAPAVAVERAPRGLRPRFGSEGIAPGILALARSLDSDYRVPILGWRFGIDGIIGLVPVFGDILSAIYGAAILLEALRLRAPLGLVSRMAGNLAVDAVIGAVPLIGDAIDLFYKPNERNLRLLQAEIETRAATSAAA